MLSSTYTPRPVAVRDVAELNVHTLRGLARDALAYEQANDAYLVFVCTPAELWKREHGASGDAWQVEARKLEGAREQARNNLLFAVRAQLLTFGEREERTPEALQEELAALGVAPAVAPEVPHAP